MSVTTLNYNPAYNSGADFSWSSVTFSSSDGGLTYTGIPTTLSTQVPNQYDVRGLTIGNIVTSIDNYAFNDCYQMTSVTFSTTSIVTSIGTNAFYNCSGLPSITIPDSVLTIGTSAFQNCTGLTSIVIPNNVTSIGQSAFQICYGASSVTIGSGVLTIGDNAFQSLYSITSIVIPNSVLSIGANAFQNANALTSFTIGSSVTSIGANAFQSCGVLVYIVIPDNVTTIGSFAFNDCGSFTTAYISDAEAIVLGFTGSPSVVTFPQFYNVPNNVNFVLPQPSSITGISPSGGGKTGGTPVTITGSSFTGTTSVTFGGDEATSIIVVSDTEITCITPAHAPGSVDVIVTNLFGSSEPFTFTYDTTCFKEGSKILTDKGYMLIQDLRKGDLVKTIFSGFKKIEHIGHSKMYHNVNDIRSTDKLYRCSTSEYPELTEDLIITGGHSILINDFKDHEQMEKTQDILKIICVTERHYRLPACVDDRTKIFEEQGVHTIWHFSLENTDYFNNYGVYANGLLVESTSNRMMVEKSGLTLLE